MDDFQCTSNLSSISKTPLDISDDKSKETNLNQTNRNNSHKIIAQWLGRSMRIFLSDGRALVGQFLCTDQARNVILGSAHEYLSSEEEQKQSDPRILGLAMVPGKHIVSMQVDIEESSTS